MANVSFGRTVCLPSSMAGFLSRCIEKIKSWIHWSWTYLLAVWVWVVLVVFVVYILRGPLKLSENLSYVKM
ncbi:suppressor of tumorigenicity 7 protein-like isoform X2 [Crassostrea virginica]